MILPREIAETRLLYLNAKRDQKKTKPFRLRDIAPWVLFHHEREEEGLAEADLTETIRSLIPAGDRIEVVDIRGESDGGDRISG